MISDVVNFCTQLLADYEEDWCLDAYKYVGTLVEKLEKKAFE